MRRPVIGLELATTFNKEVLAAGGSILSVTSATGGVGAATGAATVGLVTAAVAAVAGFFTTVEAGTLAAGAAALTGGLAAGFATGFGAALVCACVGVLPSNAANKIILVNKAFICTPNVKVSCCGFL